MKLLNVQKSERDGKKWKATFILDNGKKKTTHFGSEGANDYLITGDKEARTRYWIRHSKDLRTNNPSRAGFLSLFLLWNKETLEASIEDFKDTFGL